MGELFFIAGEGAGVHFAVCGQECGELLCREGSLFPTNGTAWPTVSRDRQHAQTTVLGVAMSRKDRLIPKKEQQPTDPAWLHTQMRRSPVSSDAGLAKRLECG